MPLFDLITLILNSIIGAFIFKKMNAPFRYTWLFLLLTLFSEGIGLLTTYFFNENLTVYTIYSILLPIAIFLIFYFLQEKKNQNKYLFSLGFLFAFIIFNTIYIQSEEPLPTNNQQATCLYFILLSVFQYNQLLKGPAEVPLSRNSEFWLNTTLFIYFSGTFVPWVVFNMFLKSAADFDSILEWNYYLTILLYVGLMVSMLIDAYGRTRPNQ